MNEIRDHRPRPYTIIEDTILDCSLSVYEKMVLICIIKYAGNDGQAWPGIKTIAKISGISERHARRILRQLEKQGLLRTEARSGRSSLYHIPEFILRDGQMIGVWDSPPGADQQSALPGPPVRTPRTRSPPTPDCQSAEHYQVNISKKISLSKVDAPPPKVIDNGKKDEREFFDHDVIKAWEKEFSVPHQPESPEEMRAMDWMLFASQNKQLSGIKSPLAYLKTITRKGHPVNFPSLKERIAQAKERIIPPPSSMQRWQTINQVHKNLYIFEAKASGVQEDQIEETAYHLFAAEYEKELGEQIFPSRNSP